MSETPSSLPIVFCFAGQGSQYHHMAADLLETHPVFRKWMDVGDAIVQEKHHFSPIKKIYDPERTKSDPFDNLAHSHPSLFITQFAVAKMLQHEGVRPNMLFGISLGEFVGMSVSGMIAFHDALLAVVKQPAIFQDTAPAGKLIAALSDQGTLKSTALLHEKCEVVGVNAAQHSVLACLKADIDLITAELRKLDISFQELPVPFAFHSKWIEPAHTEYLKAAENLAIDTPFWPLWSSHFGARIETANADKLWQIVRGKMNVEVTLKAIEAEGGAHYVDLSPTGSISAILRGALPKSSASTYNAVLSPFGGNVKRLADVIKTFAR